jgi:hypothetical protein
MPVHLARPAIVLIQLAHCTIEYADLNKVSQRDSCLEQTSLEGTGLLAFSLCTDLLLAYDFRLRRAEMDFRLTAELTCRAALRHLPRYTTTHGNETNFDFARLWGGQVQRQLGAVLPIYYFGLSLYRHVQTVHLKTASSTVCTLTPFFSAVCSYAMLSVAATSSLSDSTSRASLSH